MTNFTIQEIVAPGPWQKVFKLFRNDKCLIDEFKDEILKDHNLKDQWYELMAILKEVSENKMIPKTRFRKLSLGVKIKQSMYEAKSKHLRLYILKENDAEKILIIGGKKKTQKKDIERIKRILKEYTHFQNQLKNNNHDY